MNYYESDTKKTEKFAVELLNKLGIKCYLNNLENITDVDIKTNSGLSIDVQFSKNFDIYGDYRLDIISAYQVNDLEKSILQNRFPTSYKYDHSLRFKENFERKYNVKVTKLGKIFQKDEHNNDYLDALIIFFYNGKTIDTNHSNLNKILIIKKEELIKFLKENKETLFNRIKLNDKQKNNLSDKHGSAFIPINANYLSQETMCIFKTLDEILLDGENLRNYLLNT